VRRYGEEAANVGQQIGDAMTNAFHGAEDALVNFAMTGKLSFGDLARSILADLARIQAKNLIMSLTSSGNGIGALGGGLGGLFARWETMAGAGGTSSATGGMGIMGDVIVPSAAGGFDIPAGSNPMTQLHEREMVLPKQHADVIRGLANGGGASAGSISLSPVYNIQIDSRSDRSAIQADVQRAVANGNAQLVDQLSRAGKL
jgi:lambda family phage tail tape measure protein